MLEIAKTRKKHETAHPKNTPVGTDRQTRGRFNISRPGPSAQREITSNTVLTRTNKNIQ